MIRFSQTSFLFEEVFLQEALGSVQMPCFPSPFGRAASSFWQSVKSDTADLEQKEQSLEDKTSKNQRSRLHE